MVFAPARSRHSVSSRIGVRALVWVNVVDDKKRRGQRAFGNF